MFVYKFQKKHQLQSPKSKKLHFESKLCRRCNNDRKQLADKAFQRLHNEIVERSIKSLSSAKLRKTLNLDIKMEDSLNFSRYFSKLLCGLIIDSGGPRCIRLANFVLGKTAQNPLVLVVGQDPDVLKIVEEGVPIDFVGHGGLTIYVSRKFCVINELTSSLTAGGIRYEYSFSLSVREIIETELRFRQFANFARTKSKASS